MFFRRLAALLALGTLAPLAAAFPPTPPLPTPDTVVEYFNTGTGHYFYTWSAGDQEALQGGAFGAGWVKTGLAFAAWGTRERALYPGDGFNWAPFDACTPGRCREIVRFFAPGPNSHFFTGNANDIALLDRPGTGWIRESSAFYAALPDAAGACPTDMTPVHRLYNNRAAMNDTNHRYVASEGSRRLGIARGWIDEGVAFCAYGRRDFGGTLDYEFGVWFQDQVMDIRDCRAARTAGSCLGFMNLPIPSHGFVSSSTSENAPDEFDRQTGMWPLRHPNAWAIDGSSRAAAASRTFVQLSGSNAQPGIHLVGQDGTGGPYASIAAVRRLAAGELRPFRTEHATERVIKLQAVIGVQEAAAAAGSYAYGVLSVQFTDEVSGRSLLFNMLAYGALPEGEGAATDLQTGLPLVYTTLGGDGRFSRLTGTLPGPTSQQVTPRDTYVIAQIERRHFQAILDAARAVDRALSPRPEDYSLANLALVNETYGAGEIGMVVWDMDIIVEMAP